MFRIWLVVVVLLLVLWALQGIDSVLSMVSISLFMFLMPLCFIAIMLGLYKLIIYLIGK